MWDGEPRMNRAAPDDPRQEPRAKNGRAPDPYRLGGWMPMREYRDRKRSTSPSSGPVRVEEPWPRSWPETGFSVVAFDAGPWFWRPLDEFASDESEQEKLYWTDKRIVDGGNPVHLGHEQSAANRSVADSSFRDGVVALPPGGSSPAR